MNFCDIKNIWNCKILKNLELLDLCCGAGGGSLGFKQVGFSCFGIDFDKNSIESYQKNIGNCEKMDITKPEVLTFLEKKYKNNPPFVILAGIPCQDFSTENRYRKKIDEGKNTMYLFVSKIIKILKPRWVIIENVKGLLSTFNAVLKISQMLINNSYNVNYKVLKSRDFNNPTLRERVFFIANNVNLPIFFPFPIINNYKHLSISNIINNVSHENDIFNLNQTEKIKKLKPNQRLYQYNTQSIRLLPFKIHPTIISVPNIHYKENRYLSINELKALQSFPNDFIFYGSYNSILQQIANSIPPPLAKAVALSICVSEKYFQVKKIIQKSIDFK